MFVCLLLTLILTCVSIKNCRSRLWATNFCFLQQNMSMCGAVSVTERFGQKGANLTLRERASCVEIGPKWRSHSTAFLGPAFECKKILKQNNQNPFPGYNLQKDDLFFLCVWNEEEITRTHLAGQNGLVILINEVLLSRIWQKTHLQRTFISPREWSGFRTFPLTVALFWFSDRYLPSHNKWNFLQRDRKDLKQHSPQLLVQQHANHVLRYSSPATG